MLARAPVLMLSPDVLPRSDGDSFLGSAVAADVVFHPTQRVLQLLCDLAETYVPPSRALAAGVCFHPGSC